MITNYKVTYYLFLILTFLFCLSTMASEHEEESDDVITLPPVVVKIERIEKKPKHSFKGFSVIRAVGTGGDPLRVLDELPSVGVLNDFVGILSVRGGGPEDNLYYFDRLPLGYPYHLFGIVSTVNAEVIQNIEVYPGGYGAEFGADSQAVIDIYSRSITDKWVGGKVNLNPVYAQAFLEGKIGQRGYWYVFGRQSYMEALFGLVPRLFKINSDFIRQVPRFLSYQGKGVYQLSKIHRVVVNAIGANDSAQFLFGSDEVSDSDFRGLFTSENPFDSQGVHFHSVIEKTFKSVISLTRSFSQNEINYGEGYFYRDLESVISLRGDLQYWAKFPITLLESGFTLSSIPTNLLSIGSRPLEEGDWDYDVRLKKDGEKVQTDITKSMHRFEAYTQGTRDLASSRYVDLYATIGMRATYFSLIDSFSLQPRGLLGITLGPEQMSGVGISFLPIDLRFMFGKYVQNPQLFQIALGNNNHEITQSFARHYVLTLEKRLTPETRVEIAGYYKDLHDLIAYNKSEKSYQNSRTGWVKGLEVSLEHEIGDVLRSWVAYSYTVSKRQDSPFEKERDYFYSTPHVFTTNFNYLFGEFEFGVNWQYKSGALYSPLEDRERYTNPHTGNVTWIPIYGDPLRTIPYHRLDLRFHWSFSIYHNWKGGLTLELWNAYNRTNYLQVRYNSDYTKEVPIAQLPLVPFLALTLEF